MSGNPLWPRLRETFSSSETKESPPLLLLKAWRWSGRGSDTRLCMMPTWPGNYFEWTFGGTGQVAQPLEQRGLDDQTDGRVTESHEKVTAKTEEEKKPQGPRISPAMEETR